MQWLLSNEICADTHLRDYCGKDRSRICHWNLDGKKYRSTGLETPVRSDETRIILIGVCVDDIKMARNKQKMDPMWKDLMRNVDLDEPTSFLDHVYLGWTRRECKLNEIIFEQYKEMFQSRISSGATENYQGGKSSR